MGETFRPRTPRVYVSVYGLTLGMSMTPSFHNRGGPCEANKGSGRPGPKECVVLQTCRGRCKIPSNPPVGQRPNARLRPKTRQGRANVNIHRLLGHA